MQKEVIVLYLENIIFKNPNRPVKMGIGNRVSRKGDAVPEHFHPELEFLVIEKGCKEACTDECDLIGKDGDIIFINRNIVHSTEVLEDGICHLVQFRRPSLLKEDFRYLSSLLRQAPIPGFVFHPEDPDYRTLWEALYEMLEHRESNDISSDYIVTSNIYKILSMLYRRKFLSDQEISLDPELIQRVLPVLRYINDHIKEDLSLESLAEMAQHNKSYLCRLFKRATGVTLFEYINYVRICKAEELLKTNMRITEVAYETGFSSLSYFNRCFHKYKQCGPQRISYQI